MVERGAMVTLEGHGLHGGKRSRIVLARGPSGAETSFLHHGVRLPLSAAVPSGARRSTELAWGAFTVRTTEHLLAALAALGLHRGVTIAIEEGDEVPLLDGGAALFVAALRELAIAPSSPRLVVARDAELALDRTSIRFEVAPERAVAVTIDFGDARLAPDASWDGTEQGFATIAPARTFGFGHELVALADRGLASHVSRESVVVVTDEAILSAGPPFSSDEPARHKLLDLVGDLFVRGGPPRGRVHARLPGHAATHALVARALREGVLVPA